MKSKLILTVSVSILLVKIGLVASIYHAPGRASAALNVGCPTSPEWEAKFIRAIDGDTISVQLHDFDDPITVRIKGVNTPEIKGKTIKERRKAKLAKAWVHNELSGKELLLRFQGRCIDRYRRFLAWVLYRLKDGTWRALDQALIKNKLGRIYYGGKRMPWY